MDTYAAQINACDLIITIDNTTAHLAGALGKPTWTLLPYIPDWRWLLKRPDTPWYPNMTLIRQNTPKNWDALIETITKKLQQQWT